MGACNDTLRFLFVNESLVPTKDLTLTDAPILGVQSSQGWSLADMGRGHKRHQPLLRRSRRLRHDQILCNLRLTINISFPKSFVAFLFR